MSRRRADLSVWCQRVLFGVMPFATCTACRRHVVAAVRTEVYLVRDGLRSVQYSWRRYTACGVAHLPRPGTGHPHHRAHQQSAQGSKPPFSQGPCAYRSTPHSSGCGSPSRCRDGHRSPDSSVVTATADGDDVGVVVGRRARSLMRVMRPVVWMVLQDMVFDAEWRDDPLVASTSARLVADHLHLDPSTTASAMRTLRARGVVELEQASAANGRFGLAAYTLHLPDGIDVWSRRTQTSHTDNPHTVTTFVGSAVLSCPWDGLDLSPRVDSSHTEQSSSAIADASEPVSTDSIAGRVVPSPFDRLLGSRCVADAAHGSEPAQPPRVVRRRRSSAPAPVEQGAFDLGPGTQ